MNGIFLFPLSDDFNRHDGAMVNYLAADHLTAITPRHHYDIRAFHVTDQTLPFTQTDYNFWHGYSYNSLNVNDARSLGTLAGTETWPSSGSITVGKDAAYRYSNTIRINVSAAAAGDGVYGLSTFGVGPYGTGTSAIQCDFTDDLFTDFHNPARTYYVELVLRSFPAQSTTPHFDLSNSFIDFSSTTNYAAGTFDSLPFSLSLNNVSAGGDTFLRFPATLLKNTTLTNVRSVRLRLTPVGGTTLFIGQALRLVDDQYTWQLIDVDTKRGQLTRSVPRAGGTESSSVYGDVYFKYEQPKDVVYQTQFNAGHHPSGNDNVLRQFFRTQTNSDRIEIKLTSRDTQSRLFIIQTLAGVTTTITSTAINTNILAQESSYFLISELSGTQVRASIYNRTGIGLGSLLYTTGWQTVGLTSRGLIGYSFEPYNYDFTVQYIAPQSTTFAAFQTTAFNSIKAVRGATLYPTSSTPQNILSASSASAWGDATILTDANGDLNITRAGTLTQGGVFYSPQIFLGDTSQMVISGSIWTTVSQGTYRLALIDNLDEVLWTGTITNVLPNQWNAFTFNVSPGLPPENVYLHIQQTGTYSGTFKLRNIATYYNTISWLITPDNGTTWIPFLSAIGGEFTGVKFPANTNSMTLRATATTDIGWIGGYQLQPQYVY